MASRLAKAFAVAAALITVVAVGILLATSAPKPPAPYTNNFFGLSFTPAPGLKFDDIKSPQSGQTFVLFQAYGTRRLLSGRTGTVAYADQLSYYPEGQQSPEAYLRKIVRNQKGSDYEVLQEQSDCKLGSLDCKRADFRKGSLLEAVMVITRRGFALVFIFTAGSEEELAQVIRSSRVEFKDK